MTNNNYNMNKSNVMINLNTSIVGDNLNLEKLKIEQKLIEYRKLIDKKINELMINKKRNINQKKKSPTYEKHKTNAKVSSPKNYEIYKKASMSYINSNYGKKRKINNISKTNYKYLDKEYFKNIHDINILIPKKMNVFDNNNNINKKIVNSNSQTNMKIRRNSKNKYNIISKNIEEKDNTYLINNETTNKNNNSNDIHEQITSKGNAEKESDNEDNKK